MKGHRSRYRENDDLPLRRGPVVKKTPPFSNARVKLCAVGMRNAILGNDFKATAIWARPRLYLTAKKYRLKHKKTKLQAAVQEFELVNRTPETAGNLSVKT